MANFERDGGGGGAVQPVCLSVKGAPLLMIFPTQYTQKSSCQLIGSPSEKGLKQFDNKVRQPATVTFTGIVKYTQRSVFKYLQGVMKKQKLADIICEFQTKAGNIKNMIIETLEEVGESNRYDGMEIRVQLQEYLEHNAT